MSDTFGDRYHRRRTDDGRARTRREALDRAAYDHNTDQARDGGGCAAPLMVLATTIAAILGVLLG
jgi:hypothetical protein